MPDGTTIVGGSCEPDSEPKPPIDPEKIVSPKSFAGEGSFDDAIGLSGFAGAPGPSPPVPGGGGMAPEEVGLATVVLNGSEAAGSAVENGSPEGVGMELCPPAASSTKSTN